MAQQFTLVGAHIQVFVNNKVLKEVQGASISIDYGETQIRGIDTPYAQEIAVSQINVSGQFTMVRQKNSGGLQALNMRPLFGDVAASPYISIRIHDRQSGEDIISIPQAKITKEDHSTQAKGRYAVTIAFSGVIPLQALDRAT